MYTHAHILITCMSVIYFLFMRICSSSVRDEAAMHVHFGSSDDKSLGNVLLPPPMFLRHATVLDAL